MLGHGAHSSGSREPARLRARPGCPGCDQVGQQRSVAAPAGGVLAAIAEAAAGANRYPDLSVTGLTARLADEFGLDAARIAVGCGSVSLCQQLVAITCREPGDEVVYAWRSFESYPIVTQVQGATKRVVPLDAEFRHDLEAMAAAVTPRTRLVLLCTPNNPTGTAVRRDEFERFLQAVGPDVLVALDEAYREFVTDPDAVDGTALLDAHPNLVVLRTFSKAYRLAGLRVGYALGTPEVAQALRKVGSPFAVSAIAQAAALAALTAAPSCWRGAPRWRVSGNACGPRCSMRVTPCRRRRPTSSGWRSVS